MRRLPGLRSWFVGASTAIVVLGLTVLPFLTPTWVGFEQGRAQSAAWTGFNPAELQAATDSILADLVVGPPDFDVTVAGTPVLKPAERAHMRDVRSVFTGFYVVAGIALAILVLSWITAHRSGARRRTQFLRAARAGAATLAVALVVAGVVAAVAFDAAFEVFHSLFFPAGTYNFDPQTDRLVQLFPDVFWSETTMVVGAVAIVASAILFVAVGRRLRAEADEDRSVSPAVEAPGQRPTGPISASESGPTR